MWFLEVPNNNSVTTDDYSSHGTHVAGIVGAVGDNEQGVAGLCWRVRLVPLQVVNPSTGLMPVEKVTEAINYARLNGIDILNYSGGGSTNNPLREQAISQYPGLFVCSAGNNNSDNDNPATPYYPANHALNNLIAVGSIDSNGNKSLFSNKGATKVEIFAPGDNIYSTIPGSYDYKSGTSMAAPFVAGAAALVKSIHPNMTGAALKVAILNNVDTRPELSGLCSTGGRLNAYKAVIHIPVVGKFSIRFDGTGLYTSKGSQVGNIGIGQFTLFQNGSYIINDGVMFTYPIRNFDIQNTTFTHSAMFTHSAIPSAISNYLGNSSIVAYGNFYIPCGPNTTDYSYYRIPVNVFVSGNTAITFWSTPYYYEEEILTSNSSKKMYISTD